MNTSALADLGFSKQAKQFEHGVEIELGSGS
jgi:hypothetical protein